MRQVLGGFRSCCSTAELRYEVAQRHLRWLGAGIAPGGNGEEGFVVERQALAPRSAGGRRSAGPPLGTTISWFGPSAFASQEGSEAVVQALCGLMAVHGRDRGRPRRLGIEVASVAAGVLGVQGVLAALIGRSRGHSIQSVETSVLQAGLVLVSHYMASATAGAVDTLPDLKDGVGPPFPTADGHWVELETLRPESWRSFWHELGIDGLLVAKAWRLFVQRYETATCRLPTSFHQATGRRTLEHLTKVAVECEVSLCRVRHYGEVCPSTGVSAARPWAIELGSRGGQSAQRLLRSSAHAPRRPLEGLRVVEATRRIQGPLAGLLLQMLGAEVIRVEPRGGDLLRMVPPVAGAVGAIFLAFNRGKQAIELDPKRPADRRDLIELVSGADVFLHNWRWNKAAELSLTFDDLARHHPRLVYAYAGGWGPQNGSLPPIATDYLVQAYAAAGDGLNPCDEPPFPTRVVLADLMGGLVACEGVLAALLLSERSNRGCQVQTSLLGGAMDLQAHILKALTSGRESGRRAGRPVWSLLDRPIETAEGFLVLSADGSVEFLKLCEACSLEPEAATHIRLSERLRSRPADEWAKLLLERGVPCAVAPTDLKTLAHDQRLTGLLEPAGGACTVPAAPWTFV